MDETRDRLAREMEKRRKKLRLRWPQVAQLAGVSVQTLLRIRNGTTPVTDFAAEGIEQALQWPSDTVATILAGRQPSPPPESPLAETDPVTLDEVVRELLVQAYEVYSQRYTKPEAKRRLDQRIREIYDTPDRTPSGTSDRPDT
jgi:transcriptional regulator with XRE-family HTH domain